MGNIIINTSQERHIHGRCHQRQEQNANQFRHVVNKAFIFIRQVIAIFAHNPKERSKEKYHHYHEDEIRINIIIVQKQDVVHVAVEQAEQQAANQPCDIHFQYLQQHMESHLS